MACYRVTFIFFVFNPLIRTVTMRSKAVEWTCSVTNKDYELPRHNDNWYGLSSCEFTRQVNLFTDRPTQQFFSVFCLPHSFPSFLCSSPVSFLFMYSNRLFIILHSPRVQHAIAFSGIVRSFSAQGNHHNDRLSQTIQTKQSQSFNKI